MPCTMHGMEPKVCKVDGCTNRVRARGMCARHYDNWRAEQTPCSVKGCPNGARARGLCATHLARWRKTGDPGTAALLRKPTRPCKVLDCGNNAVTKDDLCATHRRRKRLYGNEDGSFLTSQRCSRCAEPAVPTPRSSEFCRDHYIDYVKSLVVAGEPLARTDPAGYRYVSIFKKSYAEHSIVMESVLGRPLRQGENVHHRNGRRDDNRSENLELWVSPQTSGQRVEDLVAWVVDSYPEYVRAAIEDRPQLHLFSNT